ncbi:MAG TPA: hypothetical protein VMH20_00195 [Verrucomicrobiae bacterium]|nr:hypothetical protein [Verrucomicrobiae bacterium]
MKKAILAGLFVLASAGLAMGQTWSSTVDVLGAHNNGGRGCAGCHSPHSGAFGSGHLPKSPADTGSYALWGQDASPLYGVSLGFGDNGKYVEVLPSSISTGSQEVGGILLCLSCHDGNLTAHNMMTNQSYEQKMGMLTNTAYGSNPIPTLLGNDGSGAGNYTNDHPVGQNATISASTANGLVFANNAFTVTAGSNYAKFVANYGWPALAPGAWSNPYAINGAGKPYVVCTTCHNQHVMTVYTATTSSPIAGQTTGYYATYFFINGPYNPNITVASAQTAPSTTQFCRQCHFGEANEANNTFTITTQFQ